MKECLKNLLNIFERDVTKCALFLFDLFNSKVFMLRSLLIMSSEESSDSEYQDITGSAIEEIKSKIKSSNIKVDFKPIIVNTLDQLFSQSQQSKVTTSQIASTSTTYSQASNFELLSNLTITEPLVSTEAIPLGPIPSVSPNYLITNISSDTSSSISWTSSRNVVNPALIEGSDNLPSRFSVFEEESIISEDPKEWELGEEFDSLCQTYVVADFEVNSLTDLPAIYSPIDWKISVASTSITSQQTSTPLNKISDPLSSLTAHFGSSNKSYSPILCQSSTASGQSLRTQGSSSSATTPAYTSTTQSITTAISSTMAHRLSAQDITEITNIFTNNNPSQDSGLRKFHGDPKDAAGWMEEFQYFSAANGWNDDKKIQKLGTKVSDSAREWYTIDINGQGLGWNEVLNRFNRQFMPAGYERQMKQEFRTRKQKLFESSANYICTMRAILNKSGQNPAEADAVDAIIHNMLPQIAEKLIILNPRTYADLRSQANLVEQSLKASQEGNDGQVLALTQAMNQLSLRPNDTGSESLRPRNFNYNNSNNFNSRTRRGGPRCFKCNRIGHVQAMCRSNQNTFRRNNFQRNFTPRNYNNSSNNNNFNNNRWRPRNRWNGRPDFRRNRGFGSRNNGFRRNNAGLLQQESGEPEQNVNVLNVIGSATNGFIINVLINGNEVKAVLDTGASVSFLSYRYAKDNNLIMSAWRGKGYSLANGIIVKPCGETKIRLDVTINGQTKSAELSIYIIKGLTNNVVIGYNVIRKLGIVINGRDNTVNF